MRDFIGISRKELTVYFIVVIALAIIPLFIVMNYSFFIDDYGKPNMVLIGFYDFFAVLGSLQLFGIRIASLVILIIAERRLENPNYWWAAAGLVFGFIAVIAYMAWFVINRLNIISNPEDNNQSLIENIKNFVRKVRSWT